VNNLLDMARIQSGGFNLKKEWLTLEEVVGSALQMLEPDGCRYRRVNCAHFPFQLHGHHPAAFRQFIAYQTNVSGFHCGIGGFYRRRHPDGFD
jgi:signal transduction histidine kinase